MEIKFTNGKNKDFVDLCNLLDDNLDEIIGGIEKREKYIKYNTLNDIHDVILIYDNDLPIACASFKYYDEGIAEVKRVLY